MDKLVLEVCTQNDRVLVRLTNYRTGYCILSCAYKTGDEEAKNMISKLLLHSASLDWSDHY